MKNQPPMYSVEPSGTKRIPIHVVVIMDGNGRWARERNLGRLEGHKRGVNNVRTLVECCMRKEIPYLSLFAFSSENWRRPKQEVEWLMRLLSGALDKEVRSLHSNDVRLRFIGDRNGLPKSIQSKMTAATRLTESNSKLCLTIALNYGGQWDLTQACRTIARMAVNGELQADEISPETINQFLSTASIPDPDLFIRTGGEKRMSNFMLWQLAYTELYFTDKYWPDFDQSEFAQALASYASRIRRFGGIITAPETEGDQHA